MILSRIKQKQTQRAAAQVVSSAATAKTTKRRIITGGGSTTVLRAAAGAKNMDYFETATTTTSSRSQQQSSSQHFGFHTAASVVASSSHHHRRGYQYNSFNKLGVLGSSSSTTTTRLFSMTSDDISSSSSSSANSRKRVTAKGKAKPPVATNRNNRNIRAQAGGEEATAAMFGYFPEPEELEPPPELFYDNNYNNYNNNNNNNLDYDMIDQPQVQRKQPQQQQQQQQKRKQQQQQQRRQPQQQRNGGIQRPTASTSSFQERQKPHRPAQQKQQQQQQRKQQQSRDTIPFNNDPPPPPPRPAASNIVHMATPGNDIVSNLEQDPAELKFLESLATVPEDQLYQDLESRPKSDGTGSWDVRNPLGWTNEFGSRSTNQTQILEQLAQLKPGDEGYHHHDEAFNITGDYETELPDVTIVRTKEEAKIVLQKLWEADPDTIFHACDTEVMEIDIKSVGPVGNGFVTCLSVYSGPNFDYGLRSDKKLGTSLWIDNIDDSFGVMQEFKEWLEDPKYKKIWHNYGFDRHVMFNEGIDVQGLAADTMHMARLQDTSRTRSFPPNFQNNKPKPQQLPSNVVSSDNNNNNTTAAPAAPTKNGYSLEALTDELLQHHPEFSSVKKKSMKEIFGVRRLRKDGSEGNIIDLPKIEEMQRLPQFRKSFIEYSCRDAKGTYLIHQVLAYKLTQMEWKDKYNLYDYYYLYMRPFGEVLTDMERRGIFIDAKYLHDVELQARKDRDHHSKIFRNWVTKHYLRLQNDQKKFKQKHRNQIEDKKDKKNVSNEYSSFHGLAINPASSIQLQTLLFGGTENQKTRVKSELTRIFKVAKEEIPDDAIEAFKKEQQIALNKTATAREQGNEAAEAIPDELDYMTATQLKSLCKVQKLKVAGKKDDLKQRLRDHFLGVTTTNDNGNDNNSDNSNDDMFSSMKVAELKQFCKENGLKVSGKKADLQERLREHLGVGNSNSSQEEVEQEQQEKDEFDAMSDVDLRDSLVVRGLSGEGTREELLTRIRNDIQFSSEIISSSAPLPGSSDNNNNNNNNNNAYIAISEALVKLAEQEKEKQMQNGDIGDGDGDGTSGMGIMAEIMADIQQKKELEMDPKFLDVAVHSLQLPFTPEKFTQGGAPSVTADVLRKLAGDPYADPPKYGTAYEALDGGDAGHEACIALHSLYSIGSIDTMIGNFLTSLQSLNDDKSRVHCSLNLNTETGRLSSRRPNLQNQPALEKDKYKIRQAFQASTPKNNLIVADYGQLELRLLASMTDCKSMIDAFEAGGDFHSRTAVDMFDYVQQAIADGDVILEWDYSCGKEPDKPLVKDKYASERRKAKTLNFSIAYGKTAHGLSQDWGVSIEEAEKMLKKWYDARPEVLEWQTDKKHIARTEGYTRTLMGRYRQLPEAKLRNRKFIGQAERASINTPIQGGAADVAMMAMIKINQSTKLKRLGWILLLQIHDEVILEGPEETAKEAFDEVIKCMEEPWVYGLDETKVPLIVDGSYIHRSWYDAK